MQVIEGKVFATIQEYSANLPSPRRGLKYEDGEKERSIILLLSGFSLLDIASEVGRTTKAICDLLQQARMIKSNSNPGYFPPFVYTKRAEIESAKLQIKEAPISQEETTMFDSKEPVVELVLIFGKDLNTLSDDELIDAIRKVESQITSYSNIKTASTKIKKRVEDLQTQLNKIVEALDSRP